MKELNKETGPEIHRFCCNYGSGDYFSSDFQETVPIRFPLNSPLTVSERSSCSIKPILHCFLPMAQRRR
ncbi:unnamed protein product [Prunus brigantina]